MEKDKIEETNNDRCYTVYMHTSPSGKRYVGITSLPLEKRWQKGYGYRNQIFYRAVQKYGFDNIKHEVLFEKLTKEEAEEKEIELISFYKSDDCRYGYNVAHGGNSMGMHSEETKRKIGEASRNISNETRIKMGNSRRGKHHTEETKTKIKESLSCIRGSNHPHSRRIYQYDVSGSLIRVWEYIKQIYEELNFDPSSIVRCCRHKQFTSYGYIWRYTDDENNEFRQAI